LFNKSQDTTSARELVAVKDDLRLTQAELTTTTTRLKQIESVAESFEVKYRASAASVADLQDELVLIRIIRSH
jgi:hypothetical protein